MQPLTLTSVNNLLLVLEANSTYKIVEGMLREAVDIERSVFLSVLTHSISKTKYTNFPFLKCKCPLWSTRVCMYVYVCVYICSPYFPLSVCQSRPQNNQRRNVHTRDEQPNPLGPDRRRPVIHQRHRLCRITRASLLLLRHSGRRSPQGIARRDDPIHDPRGLVAVLEPYAHVLLVARVLNQRKGEEDEGDGQHDVAAVQGGG